MSALATSARRLLSATLLLLVSWSPNLAPASAEQPG